jgi:hypothetical protein
MAKAQEDQSGHSLHRREAHPIPLDRAAYKRRNVIERMFCKLTHVLQAKELATHRDSIRPTRSKLSLQPRSRRYLHRMDLIESPT